MAEPTADIAHANTEIHLAPEVQHVVTSLTSVAYAWMRLQSAPDGRMTILSAERMAQRGMQPMAGLTSRMIEKYNRMLVALREHFNNEGRKISFQERQGMIMANAPEKLSVVASGGILLEQHILAALVEHELRDDPLTDPWIRVMEYFGTRPAGELQSGQHSLTNLLLHAQPEADIVRSSHDPAEVIMTSYVLGKI